MINPKQSIIIEQVNLRDVLLSAHFKDLFTQTRLMPRPVGGVIHFYMIMEFFGYCLTL